MEIIVIALGVFTTILAGWVGLGAGRGRRARTLARRIRAAGGRHAMGAAGAGAGGGVGNAQAVTLRRDVPGGRGLDKVLGRLLPNIETLRQRLARTGKPITVTAYIAASFGIVVAVAGAMIWVIYLNPVVSVLSGVAAGLMVPHLAIAMMGKRRLAEFNHLFPDAIDLMVRGLRSGLPVTECIKAVGRELPDPVGGEFRRITDEIKFGSKTEEALWATAHRLDIPEFKFFVVSLSVQQETGGNLAETLANLSDILRRRKQMRLKIKAMSSEAKASAMILGSLPFVMFCIIYAINPDYEAVLFTDPRGRLILGVGLAAMGAGILVMAKMVRFEI